VIGVSLRNILVCDLKFPKFSASVFVCGMPLLLFLIGFQSFISIVGFMGTIMGTIDGIAIILMYQKSKKNSDREPEYKLKVPTFLFYVLILIFIIGAGSQILYN
jgi:hypothetical protein